MKKKKQIKRRHCVDGASFLPDQTGRRALNGLSMSFRLFCLFSFYVFENRATFDFLLTSFWHPSLLRRKSDRSRSFVYLLLADVFFISFVLKCAVR